MLRKEGCELLLRELATPQADERELRQLHPEAREGPVTRVVRSSNVNGI